MVYTQRLPERATGPRLGRHVEHDERSRAFPVRTGCNPLALVRPKSVQWTRRAPILDQGQLGSCTGNAMAGLIGTDSAGRRGDATVTEDLAVELYSLATEHDEFDGVYPPDDTGSSGLAVMKAAKAQGYVSAYRHAFTWRQVLAALQSGPVITGIPWREAMFTPDATGLVRYQGDEAGGHEFEVVGCDTQRQVVKCLNSWGEGQVEGSVTAPPFAPGVQVVKCLNSWGEGWGSNGAFYLTFADFRRALADHGDVTVPVWA